MNQLTELLERVRKNPYAEDKAKTGKVNVKVKRRLKVKPEDEEKEIYGWENDFSKAKIRLADLLIKRFKSTPKGLPEEEAEEFKALRALFDVL